MTQSDELIERIDWEEIFRHLLALARHRVHAEHTKSPEDVAQSAATSFAAAMQRGEVSFPDDFDGSWECVIKIVVKLADGESYRKGNEDTLKKAVNRKIQQAYRDNHRFTSASEFVLNNIVDKESTSHELCESAMNHLEELIRREFHDETIRRVAERKIFWGESPRTIAPILGLTYYDTRKASEAIEKFLRRLEGDPDISFDSLDDA